MVKILKRPMFKRGGSTNDGIMTGLTNRKQLSTGTLDPERARREAKEIQDIMESLAPVRRTRLPLGELGLALARGVDPLDALDAGYRDFIKRDDARRALLDKRKQAAVSTALGSQLNRRNAASVLAAEKEARFLLPENATPAQIRAKTAELLKKKYTGVTYGPQAEYSRLKSEFFKLYNDEDQAQRHADFVTKVKPKLSDDQISRGRVTKDQKGNYKFKKGPGVYIDTLDAKVILFTGDSFKELPELSALVR